MPARILCSLLMAGLLPVPLAAQYTATDEGMTPQLVSPVLEERSVLLPRGGLVLEPSLQYIHSSATQVAIEGFTIIPAIAIGLINVSEVQRDSVIAALALRYGIHRRLEGEIRVPYVWREEHIRQREVLEGTDFSALQNSRGKGLGDVELGLRYQFNRGLSGPIAVGNLRVKTTTGEGPFDVARRPLLTEGGAEIGETFSEQPTGSGFWTVQPGLTLIAPSDPAVLYGNGSYAWNIERDVGGDAGRVDPGNVFGLGFGVGFALNNRTSLSVGYDHAVVSRTRRENDAGLEPTFDRLQVGSALLGFSHRLSPEATFNLGVAIGTTSAAPDVQISARIPLRVR